MLTFVEEMLLLMLDDENGAFLPVRESTVEYVMCGAVLMDLAFENRIDTDQDKLFVISTEPTGNPLLDQILSRISGSEESRDTRAWIEMLAVSDATNIREQGLARLVERGILECRDEKFLWVFRSRRYPVIDGKAEREAKLRIMDVLFSDAIPDPRDAALICLVDVCDIFGDILSARELERIAPRIQLIRKMDLIGREISGAVAEIENSIMMAMAQAPH